MSYVYIDMFLLEMYFEYVRVVWDPYAQNMTNSRKHSRFVKSNDSQKSSITYANSQGYFR